MDTISCKKKFFELYLAGRLGNKLRVFASPSELRESKYNGTVTARSTSEHDKTCLYRLSWQEAIHLPGHFCFNESAPDDQLLIQGEVMRTPGGLYLRYSTERSIPIRIAMRSAKTAQGLKADCILKHFLNTASYEDIKELLDTYSDAVVEFSTYVKDLGDLPNRNTIIWEVRNY